MGFITKLYQKNFLQRYDKDGVIPYYSSVSFPGLHCIEESFQNSNQTAIKYFYYYYDNCLNNELILFCPGIGPGHTAYLAEINCLCQKGYRVLTLDYTGCGASGGETLYSINAPTKDAMELLELLKLEEVIVIGHSLGGYTALNLLNLSPNIKKGVIISGFVSISDEMMTFIKMRLLANRVKRFEKKLMPEYGKVSNLKYLKETKKQILWIHSTDDPMVNYKYNAGRIQKINNPNIHLLTVENKKHNPQYSYEALNNMNQWIGKYNTLVKSQTLVTLEDKKAYFNDKPIEAMTAQDPLIYDEIFKFLGNNNG